MRALLPLFIALWLASPLRAENVTVFAAASLAGPLDELARAWEAETGNRVVLSYAGSSALARQIEAGAPADVVILASEDWMQTLVAQGAINPATCLILLTNRLVVIGAEADAPMELAQLPARLGTGRLALALTEAVPAGIYARAALTHLDLWDAVAPQVVEADNVRAALRLVAIGAADYGIVYATDVAQEPRVAVLAAIPEDSHPAIRYPMALTPQASREAEVFASYLHSLPGRNGFARAGFGLP